VRRSVGSFKITPPPTEFAVEVDDLIKLILALRSMTG
jgi:hypothetical protein